jgi:hypothetical protein
MYTAEQWQELAFHCPKECGGRVAEAIRFFLTGSSELVICGCYNECGASGTKVLPIAEMLIQSPKSTFN